MNFAEMNKEQKQLLVLAVGGGLTLLLIVFNVVLNPAKARAALAEKSIAELESKVRNGELILKKDRENRQRISTLAAGILDVRQENLPPETSRYIWALQKITALARELGLREVAVQEYSGARYVPDIADQSFNKASVPMWIPYSVEAELFTSFENLKIYLDRLRAANPYASIGMLQITSDSSTPEVHRIQFILEWPVLRYADDAQWLTSVAANPEEVL